jgi:hypothetical protein
MYVDLPSVDVDFFDEESDEALSLVEVELVGAGENSAGEVLDAVA